MFLSRTILIYHASQVIVFFLATCAILVQLSDAQPSGSNPIQKDSVRGLGKRQPQKPGIQIISDNGCTPDQLVILNDAIFDAGSLAEAGINAAANFSEYPFSYFMKADAPTATKVAGVLHRVIASLAGKGHPIYAMCQDVEVFCNPGGGGLHAGYAGVSKTQNFNIVVLCPAGLLLPRNPPPCSTTTPGYISLGWAMLHELVHLDQVWRKGFVIDDLTSPGTARKVHWALESGTDTTKDTNAYAFLSTMAWDMGLGSPPWKEQTTCLQNFRTGQFDVNAYDVVQDAFSGL
ncbi:hypothetical protein MMC09_006629 [Bachmanniomyces sp. S44760]|nr:hypothetical protein [Bachmanniomyces sp. S44760]